MEVAETFYLDVAKNFLRIKGKVAKQLSVTIACFSTAYLFYEG
jgi:hypothetical protein